MQQRKSSFDLPLKLLAIVFLLLCILDIIIIQAINTPSFALLTSVVLFIDLLVFVELALFIFLTYLVSNVSHNSYVLASMVLGILTLIPQPAIAILDVIFGRPIIAGTGVAILPILLFGCGFALLSKETKDAKLKAGGIAMIIIAVIGIAMGALFFVNQELQGQWGSMEIIATCFALFLVFLTMGSESAFKFLVSLDKRVQNK